MRRHPIKPLALAFSLANLCFYGVWAYLIPTADLLWQIRYPPTRRHFLTLMGCILALTLFFRLVHGIYCNTTLRWFQKGADSVLIMVTALTLVGPLRDLIPLLPATFIPFAHKAVLALATLVLVASLLLWHPRLKDWRRPVRHSATLMLSILAPLGVLVFAHALYLVWGSPTHIQDLDEFAQHGQAHAPTPHQVVMLVFDEMDYYRVFENRPLDVILPEIDRLSHECFSASQAYSPNTSTTFSFMSILTGRYVVSKRVLAPTRIAIQWADDPAWAPLHTQTTLFSKLSALGIHSAYISWGAAYGRMLSKDLAAFYFNAPPPPLTCLPQDKKLTRIAPLALRMFYDMANSFPGVRKLNLLGYQNYEKYQHFKCVQTALGVGKIWIANPNYEFVLIHVPIPHQPFIYDRKHEAFSLNAEATTGYFDNLVYSDWVLGRFRRLMETQDSWDSSTVIVVADHGWRKAADYDGYQDWRIPFLIKLPSQKQAFSYAAPFNSIVLHQMILEFAKGQLTTPSELARWLDEHRLAYQHQQSFEPFLGRTEYAGHE